MSIPTRPRLHQIIRAVSDEFKVSVPDIIGECRVDIFVRPRQVVSWIAARHGYSLSMIGHYVGGRDHTTVLWGMGQVEGRRKDEPDFGKRLERIEANAVALTEAWMERTRTGRVADRWARKPIDEVPTPTVELEVAAVEMLPRRPSQNDPDRDYAAYTRSLNAYAIYNMRKALNGERAL